ncbi:MAG: hypothetical protein ABH883_00385 [Candidatus Omnitrophota bacterium]
MDAKGIKVSIIEQLEETGINSGLINIKILKGPKIILTGEVRSDSEKHFVSRIVADIIGENAGTESIIDRLSVSADFSDDLDGPEDEYYENRGMVDEDDESVGTQDVFQSIEDGIPYIPPDRSSFDEFSESLNDEGPREEDGDDIWNRKKKKRK